MSLFSKNSIRGCRLGFEEDISSSLRTLYRENYFFITITMKRKVPII